MSVTRLPFGTPPTAHLSGQNPYFLSLGLPVADTLAYMPCARVDAHTFTAPAAVIAVACNHILLRGGLSAPARSYTLAGLTITLTFDTDSWERVDVFCRP